MVYDPHHQVIVLFGGHSGLVRADLRKQIHLGDGPGALDDTWLYDVKTRQWRELDTDRRPPARRVPSLFWHEPSRSILLVTFTPGDQREKTGPKSTLWTLDLSAGQWRWGGEQEFPIALAYDRAYASRTPVYSVGFDPQRNVLVLVQNEREDKVIRQQTFAMQLDLDALPDKPAPQCEPATPIVPQRLPANDDPAWTARLRSLPANTWVTAEPEPYDASRRDWGNVGVDPVRGHANELTVNKIPPPWPGLVGESRGFCLLPDRQQIFYYEYRRAAGDRPERQRFWMYDVKSNRFTELNPKRCPSMGVCTVVEYLQGHAALLAIVRLSERSFEQWVYSLQHNSWAKLPLQGEQPQFAGPYGQMAYVSKYGVLVNVPKTTLLMRPDLRDMTW